MPDVTIVSKYDRNSRVKCPICGEWIPRDKLAYRTHMHETHSGHDLDNASWDTVTSLAAQDGIIDGYIYLGATHICFGCGSSFDSESDLVTHLDSVHGAS